MFRTELCKPAITLWWRYTFALLLRGLAIGFVASTAIVVLLIAFGGAKTLAFVLLAGLVAIAACAAYAWSMFDVMRRQVFARPVRVGLLAYHPNVQRDGAPMDVPLPARRPGASSRESSGAAPFHPWYGADWRSP